MRWLVLLAWLFCTTPVPTVAAADPEPPGQRLETAKSLVADMASGRFDKAVAPFDQTMWRALPADKLKEVWEGLTKRYGPLQKAAETRTEKTGQYNLVFVTCEFQHGQVDAQVVFSSADKVAGLFFVPAGKYKPPAYADSAKFAEEEVRIGKGWWTLPGTLSLPNASRSCAAVVLVHGSGPNDRDETIGPNKPFCDLAHGLASRGIAVLRFEKRTKEYPLLMTLSLNNLTVKEETIDDAAAAIELLAARKEIDPKRIFVLGHSLGGMLLPRISKSSPNVAGFISLAGSTRPLEDHFLEQTRYLLALEGESSEESQKKIREIEQQVAKVKALRPSADTSSTTLLLGAPAKYWLDLQGYDPAGEAKNIKKPMLILQGERDYQVTMQDFAGWKKALSRRSDVAFISYPALNHLFIAGEGKSSAAEYLTPGNVAKSVIDDLAKWIGGRPGKEPPSAPSRRTNSR